MPSDPQPLPESQLADLFIDVGEDDPKDEALAALEAHASSLADRLLEERFVWILIAVVLFDAHVFTHMANWAGAIIIGILQLIGVVVLADKCGVNTVRPLLDRFMGFTHKATGTGGD